jgi:hypothetical protein
MIWMGDLPDGYNNSSLIIDWPIKGGMFSTLAPEARRKNGARIDAGNGLDSQAIGG